MRGTGDEEKERSIEEEGNIKEGRIDQRRRGEERTEEERRV